MSGDEVVDRITVPQSWNSHRKAATKQIENRRQFFSEQSGVHSVRLTRDEKRSFGEKFSGLKIELLIDQNQASAPTADQLQSKVPAEVNGIAVDVRGTNGKARPGGCASLTDKQKENCIRNLDYNKNTKVEGGEAIHGKFNGTATCRVTKDNTEYMLTCAHTFFDECDTSLDLTDQEATVPSEPDETTVGAVEEFDISGDYVILREKGEGEWNRRINHRSGERIQTEGYVTYDGLSAWASLLGDDPCVLQMGLTTGLTSGRVQKVNEGFTFNCTNLQNEGVVTTCNFGEGDSGGPTFVVREGNAYLISSTSYWYPITNWYDLCNGNDVGSDSVGIPAYYLYNNEDYVFQQNLTIP
jgi:hypothetical protein